MTEKVTAIYKIVFRYCTQTFKFAKTIIWNNQRIIYTNRIMHKDKHYEWIKKTKIDSKTYQCEK